MRDPFSSEKNYNFKAELGSLPARMSATDIDLMIRGRRDMVALELKHIKQVQECFNVPTTQYYTLKYMTAAGIPAFYVFKQDDGVSYVYFVDRHFEPERGDMGCVLPVKLMGKHKSLNDVKSLVCQLITAQESFKRMQVIDLLGQLTGQKYALEDD